MRAVVQRVGTARVECEGRVTGEIGPGLLVLLGVAPGDGPDQVAWLSQKLCGLRIFEDADGKMNRSVQEAGGAMLVVSQFTLYGDCRRGRRPSFTGAAPPEQAEPLYQAFCAAVAAQGVPVATGVFGGDMQVSLVNDGPVTLVVDTP
ncbi:D-aminoacyl-tRNA deacylase [Myxococcota bacterium]|nr:D-aminoacyl-tRNA deacylase [Myxococcota bacterium]